MNKRTIKKLSLNKETLQRLEPTDLQKAKGAVEADMGVIKSWDSDCGFTCGERSCLGVCTLNCSWLC